jgi:hypothetical protein
MECLRRESGSTATVEFQESGNLSFLSRWWGEVAEGQRFHATAGATVVAAEVVRAICQICFGRYEVAHDVPGFRGTLGLPLLLVGSIRQLTFTPDR